MRYLLIILGLAVTSTVHAYNGVLPGTLWSRWNLSVPLLIAIFVPLYLYLRGALASNLDPRRTALFLIGIAALFIALVSPLDALSDSLFSAHMLQNLLVILIAAPMLVWSNPLAGMLRGLPMRWQQSAGDLLIHPQFRRVWRKISHPLPAFALHMTTLLFWYIPTIYSAGLSHPLIHTIEHLSLFLTALVYWWTIAFAREYAWRVACVFGVMIGSSILGALMTLAPAAWYVDHLQFTAAWGLSALQDQQLAGLLMWIPAGALYIAAAASLFAEWMETRERRARDNHASSVRNNAKNVHYHRLS